MNMVIVFAIHFLSQNIAKKYTSQKKWPSFTLLPYHVQLNWSQKHSAPNVKLSVPCQGYQVGPKAV
jgi:hypothetical protein